MPTKHTDTYWTNSYGCRFPTEEAALADEVQRASRPLKLVSVMAPTNIPVTEVVGWSNGLWLASSPHSEITAVHLMTDIIAYAQAQIALHGDCVGFTRRHCGMGQYIDHLCTVGPNPLHPISDT